MEFYVDFETANDLNDDFSAIPERDGQPLVFMVGCGHIEEGLWRFECFTADELAESAEAVVIEGWLDHMVAVRDRLDPGGRPQVIHWSAPRGVFAEVGLQLGRQATRPTGARCGPSRDGSTSSAQVIKPEPVVVRGAHGFGLKAITNALHDSWFRRDALAEGGQPTDWGRWSGAWWCQARGCPGSQLPG